MKNFRFWLALATLISIWILAFDFGKHALIFYPCSVIILYRFYLLLKDYGDFGRSVIPLEDL